MEFLRCSGRWLYVMLKDGGQPYRIGGAAVRFGRREQNPLWTFVGLAIVATVMLFTYVVGDYEYLLNDTGVTITRGRGITFLMRR